MLTHKAQVSELLRAFTPVILLLKGDNLFIGGSAALVIQGLLLPKDREVGDLDLILYQPTSNQLSILNTLCAVNGGGNPYPEQARRIVSVIKNTKTMHILATPDRNAPWMHTSVLIDEVGHVKVNPIDSVIEAKRGYGRAKDLKDFISLKNENFNF